MVGETQTALALILLFDLAGPEHRDRIAQSLVQNLDKHQGHLTTGFIGTPILMDALSKIGRNDLAGKLLLNETAMLPSPFITMGAFLFSVVLGVIFGMYPAIKASGLQPVVALRAE